MGKQGLRSDGTKAERHYKEMKEFGKRKNIWQYGVGGGKSGHPAVFPEALAQDHILSWSNENDLVLDCFAGSGTTLRMAKKHNRNYIGFEISAEYCGLAKQSLLMGESLPNKACSRLVGVCATYEHFPHSERILLPDIICVPPTSG